MSVIPGGLQYMPKWFQVGTFEIGQHSELSLYDGSCFPGAPLLKELCDKWFERFGLSGLVIVPTQKSLYRGDKALNSPYAHETRAGNTRVGG